VAEDAAERAAADKAAADKAVAERAAADKAAAERAAADKAAADKAARDRAARISLVLSYQPPAWDSYRPQPGMLERLSSGGRNACTAAFSIHRVSSQYTGPIFQLVGRGIVADFFEVGVWYDQSGNNSHARMGGFRPGLTLAGNRPVTVTFEPSKNMMMPDGVVPYDDQPYTVSLRHGMVGTGVILGSGSQYGGKSAANGFGFQDVRYSNFWWDDDIYGGKSENGNVVTFDYDGSKRRILVNGGVAAEKVGGGRRSGQTQNRIGQMDHLGHMTMNAGLHRLYIFRAKLSDADRAILE
jgi:hypothetical protein